MLFLQRVLINYVQQSSEGFAYLLLRAKSSRNFSSRTDSRPEQTDFDFRLHLDHR
jgi:hypothetical protein